MCSAVRHLTGDRHESYCHRLAMRSHGSHSSEKCTANFTFLERLDGRLWWHFTKRDNNMHSQDKLAKESTPIATKIQGLTIKLQNPSHTIQKSRQMRNCTPRVKRKLLGQDIEDHVQVSDSSK